MEINEATLKLKLSELEEEKLDFVTQAQKQFDQQVAAYDGAIQVLKNLLNPPKENEEKE